MIPSGRALLVRYNRCRGALHAPGLADQGSEMTSEIELEFAAVRIFVTDLQRALHFYKNVLRLKLRSGSVSDGYLVFSAGQTGSLIIESADHGTAGTEADAHAEKNERHLVGRFTGISFSVTNMFNAYNYFAQQNVAVAGPPEIQSWGGTLLTFFDPDGNRLTLVQYQVDSAAKTTTDGPQSVMESIVDVVDEATDRAIEMMENMERKIASMEESAIAEQNLSESRQKKAASLDQEKIDDELTQLKRKAGKLPPPRIVTGDDDAMLPAVITSSEIDQLPARPADLDAPDTN